MKKENKKNKPLRVRLPGFLIENETGLGDMIKRITSTVGIKPCGVCEWRADMINNWVVFKRRSQ
jgi:hypothetical protein